MKIFNKVEIEKSISENLKNGKTIQEITQDYADQLNALSEEINNIISKTVELNKAAQEKQAILSQITTLANSYLTKISLTEAQIKDWLDAVEALSEFADLFE